MIRELEYGLKSFKMSYTYRLIPLDELQTYESEWVSCCNGNGIYILYLKNKVLYVGRSKNIKKRLQDHSYKHGGVYFDTFSILPIKDDLEQRIMELLYIDFLCPIKNKGIRGFGL